MKLYIDTSALVKLWIDEEHSVEVRALVAQAMSLGSSTVAHAELGATLGRLERERKVTHDMRQVILADFSTRWVNMRRVVAGPMISRQAADLARTHALRGFDAIHLASALQFRRLVGPVQFLSFDKGLNAGAKAEGFGLL